MEKSRKYKVIVSDRAKQMLGAHVRFMAQVNKEAAAAKKKQIQDDTVYVEYILDCRQNPEEFI